MHTLIFSSILLATSPSPTAADHALNIDEHRITVSGISAGGQMAHQLHIAYSDLFSGAGIIAGGPFGCAEGSLATAMARCMSKVDVTIPVAELGAEVRNAAGDGRVAATEALADDPVWLFHGTLDQVVAVEVSDALETLYLDFIPAGQIRYVNDVEIGHVFPAKDRGHPCSASQPPFVADCDFDAAGEILEHLYPDLAAPRPEFEKALTKVSLPGAIAAGLDESAYLFIPAACVNGDESCAAHLVLHGCAQSSVQVGTEFIEQSGYLPWAAANNIVLAFPQVATGPANPYACWDWWGYTGANYRWRDGAQMQVLADWIQGLAAKEN